MNILKKERKTRTAAQLFRVFAIRKLGILIDDNLDRAGAAVAHSSCLCIHDLGPLALKKLINDAQSQRTDQQRSACLIEVFLVA